MKKVIATLGIAGLLALGGTAVSATPAAPVIQKAQAADFTGCYVSMSGQYWCYRYGCSLLERVRYRCYNGWIQINRPWYA